MATATATTSLGTSNLRGASRQTRNNPTRTSRNSRPNLRQNSLISNPPASTQGVSEPHGFYPAISHFTDAITALPRDYRRHISLLKEVDAKAWLPEENLQTLLVQCLTERRSRNATSSAQIVAGSSSNAADDTTAFSATNSVAGVPFDNASQYSSQSTDPVVLQRRQLYHSLRLNLMQMMVTMDEKNHVIYNANEDLSRHIRRLDDIWPNISDEISDEARLGSLKHWAYTDLNPPKKVVAASARREAATGLAIMADNEIAHRSESRREAMLAAKKQRLTQHVESDFDEKLINRKSLVSKGKKTELAVETASAPNLSVGKRKKPEKTTGGVGMERSASGLRIGAVTMSREPSQQDNAKKRKASAQVTNPARKRLNLNQQESPKLASSPLVNSYGKDAVKKSPALSSVRPVGRGRQNSAQTTDNIRNRPSSSASYRHTNSMAAVADNADVKAVAAATGKSTAEVRATMRETITERGDKLVEQSSTLNGESILRGGLLSERSASSRGGKKDLALEDSKAAPSPRSVPAALASETKSAGKGRASKVSTPVLGTFAETEGDDSGGANGSESGNAGSHSSKPKRPARPRMKDHHGLHDSLSPRGLPIKRTHAKNLSISSQGGSHSKNTQPPTGNRPRGSQYPELYNTRPGKPPYLELVRSKSKNSNREKTEEDELSEGEGEEAANDDENEDRYCYCNGVSYGEMVACDNKLCPREWFHLECLGLKSLPKSATWYCDDCIKQRTLKQRW